MSKDTVYLTKGSYRQFKNNTGKPKLFLLTFVLFLVGVVSIGVPFFSGTKDRAEASFGAICSAPNELGAWIGQYDWKPLLKDFPNPQATGRYWTLNEAFGSGVLYIQYQGEGEGYDSFLGIFKPHDVGSDRGADDPGWASSIDKLKEVRKNCILGPITTSLGNLPLQAASGLSGLVSYISTLPFDTGIICSEPGGTASGTCAIDLLSVVGGNPVGDNTFAEGEAGGIIGTLTSGFYMPLLGLVMVFVAVSIFWKAVVKRQFRQALFDLAWSILAFILGLAFLWNPSLVARAPMLVTNIFGSCVIGAFTGQPCLGTQETTGSEIPTVAQGEFTSGNICLSGATDPNLLPDQRLSMMLTGMNCSIWKAFVLEPWSSQMFGRSFEDLDVSRTDIDAAITASGHSRNDFCVNLASTGSKNSQGSTLMMNSSNNRVCNLAAYQMYLMTNAEMPAGTPAPKTTETASTPDTRWYPLITTLAQDDDLWQNWNGIQFWSGFETLVSLLSIIVAGIFLVYASVFALVFLFMTAVLAAFAPFFLLIGIHPGRGRKIFIGWVEQIVSNIFKYAATALILMIGITFYGLILGNVNSSLLAFVLVIIMTVALLMYRKEFITLFGQINMGGEKVVEKLHSGGASKALDKGKAMAAATVGSAAGAAYGADRSNPEKFRRAVLASAGDGLRRSARTGLGTGFAGQTISQAIRQVDRVSADNKADLSSKAAQAAGQVRSLKENVSTNRDKMLRSQTDYRENKAKLAKSSNNMNDYVNRFADNSKRRMETAHDLSVAMKFPDFEKYTGLNEKLSNLYMRKEIALANGDMDLAKSLDNEIGATQNARAKLRMKLEAENPEEFKKAMADYNSKLNDRNIDAGAIVEKKGKNKHGDDITYDSILGKDDEYKETLDEYKNNLRATKRSRDEYATDRENYANVKSEYEQKKTQSDKLKEAHRDFAAGELVSHKDIMKIESETNDLAEKNANKAKVEALEENELDNDLDAMKIKVKTDNFEITSERAKFGQLENDFREAAEDREEKIRIHDEDEKRLSHISDKKNEVQDEVTKLRNELGRLNTMEQTKGLTAKQEQRKVDVIHSLELKQAELDSWNEKVIAAENNEKLSLYDVNMAEARLSDIQSRASDLQAKAIVGDLQAQFGTDAFKDLNDVELDSVNGKKNIATMKQMLKEGESFKQQMDNDKAMIETLNKHKGNLAVERQNLMNKISNEKDILAGMEGMEGSEDYTKQEELIANLEGELERNSNNDNAVNKRLAEYSDKYRDNARSFENRNRAIKSLSARITDEVKETYVKDNAIDGVTQDVVDLRREAYDEEQALHYDKELVSKLEKDVKEADKNDVKLRAEERQLSMKVDKTEDEQKRLTDVRAELKENENLRDTYRIAVEEKADRSLSVGQKRSEASALDSANIDKALVNEFGQPVDLTKEKFDDKDVVAAQERMTAMSDGLVVAKAKTEKDELGISRAKEKLATITDPVEKAKLERSLNKAEERYARNVEDYVSQQEEYTAAQRTVAQAYRDDRRFNTIASDDSNGGSAPMPPPSGSTPPPSGPDNNGGPNSPDRNDSGPKGQNPPLSGQDIPRSPDTGDRGFDSHTDPIVKNDGTIQQDDVQKVSDDIGERFRKPETGTETVRNIVEPNGNTIDRTTGRQDSARTEAPVADELPDIADEHQSRKRPSGVGTPVPDSISSDFVTVSNGNAVSDNPNTDRVVPNGYSTGDQNERLEREQSADTERKAEKPVVAPRVQAPKRDNVDSDDESNYRDEKNARQNSEEQMRQQREAESKQRIAEDERKLREDMERERSEHHGERKVGTSKDAPRISEQEPDGNVFDGNKGGKDDPEKSKTKHRHSNRRSSGGDTNRIGASFPNSGSRRLVNDVANSGNGREQDAGKPVSIGSNEPDNLPEMDDDMVSRRDLTGNLVEKFFGRNRKRN